MPLEYTQRTSTRNDDRCKSMTNSTDTEQAAMWWEVAATDQPNVTHGHTTAEPNHAGALRQLWDDPMSRLFGIVFLLFLVTIIVGLMNVGIWIVEKKKNHARFAGGMGAEAGMFTKGTNLTFSLGRRSAAVGTVG